MANGASRIFKIMKNTADYTNTNSQFLTLAVKSINPLVFILDDRVSITSDFYVLDKNFDKSLLSIGSSVNAIMLNDSQKYYILGNSSYGGTLEQLQIKVNDLERRVRALEEAQ